MAGALVVCSRGKDAPAVIFRNLGSVRPEQGCPARICRNAGMQNSCIRNSSELPDDLCDSAVIVVVLCDVVRRALEGVHGVRHRTPNASFDNHGKIIFLIAGADGVGNRNI